jgi:hypothetical protein
MGNLTPTFLHANRVWGGVNVVVDRKLPWIIFIQFLQARKSQQDYLWIV